MTTSSTGLTAARFTALALAICTLVGGCVPSGAGGLPGPRPTLEEVRVPRGNRSPILGLLARPERDEVVRAVLVVPGRSLGEEYIGDLLRDLAAAGFVGLALDIYSLIPPGTSVPEGRRILAERVTDEEITGDLAHGVAFLADVTTSREQPAVLGFCFGGRAALLYAAFNPRAVPVVSIYGNLRLPPEAMRTTEPWDELDAFNDPVLGVYATSDREAPVADAQVFFDGLRARENPAELHVFDAAHGFFDPARPSFDRAARDSAWQEIVSFLMRAP